jgi:hypothetical protein
MHDNEEEALDISAGESYPCRFMPAPLVLVQPTWGSRGNFSPLWSVYHGSLWQMT